MSQPSVAVVILNYNGRAFLADFLPGVQQHSTSTQADVTIYVADNASTDDSVAWVREHHPAVQLLCMDTNRGFAGGYNTALAQIKADYYVLLNSDVEVTAGWIDPIIKRMEADPTIAACQPKILAHYDRTLFEHAGGAGGWMDALGYPFCQGRVFSQLETDTGQYDTPSDIAWATGAALFIRSPLYHEIGGLDADYFAHMEEIDLCWRLQRAGFRLMCIPQAVVYHVGGGTLPPTSPRKVYLNFRNSIVTLLKNEPLLKMLWLFPLRLILDGVAGLLFLTEGKWAEIAAIIKAHFYIYPRFGHIARKRADYQRRIEQVRIGKARHEGRYRGSIVWQYFVRQRRTFKQILKNA